MMFLLWIRSIIGYLHVESRRASVGGAVLTLLFVVEHAEVAGVA